MTLRKFKVGDRVIRIEDGMIHLKGSTGIIVQVDEYFLKVTYDTDKDTMKGGIEYFELEAVYNSPLYQALK